MSEVHSSGVWGTQQSPISVDTSKALYVPLLKDALKIHFSKDRSVKGVFKESNFVVSKEINLISTFRGVDYRLEKIHFHRHCEHKIDDALPSTFELHLVHKRFPVDGVPSEDKLVIANFFHVRTRKSGLLPKTGFNFLNDLIKKNAKKTSGDKWHCECLEEFSLHVFDLVPKDLSVWFTYEGSLTSYPFTEDVTWVLIACPDDVLKADVDKLLQNGADQDSRPEQLLNRRFVLKNFE